MRSRTQVSTQFLDEVRVESNFQTADVLSELLHHVSVWHQQSLAADTLAANAVLERLLKRHTEQRVRLLQAAAQLDAQKFEVFYSHSITFDSVTRSILLSFARN